MPTYRERVYLCSGESGQAGWVLEFPQWWNRNEYFKQYNDRQLDTGNPFYADYALLLAGWEAKAWDSRCRELFALDLRSKEAFFIDALQHWENLWASARWVIVETYEWGSGLE